jgi:hypothetical protein
MRGAAREVDNYFVRGCCIFQEHVQSLVAFHTFIVSFTLMPSERISQILRYSLRLNPIFTDFFASKYWLPKLLPAAFASQTITYLMITERIGVGYLK